VGERGGALLEGDRKGSQRATADTASGPQPPDRRQLDAGSAIGVKVARLRSQKRKFRLSVRGGQNG